MIELVASRYRVLRELGRGGMGIVYVVEHVHTGEQLALKVLHGHGASDPDATARFRREARVGAQIRSEHVVRVTDADVAPELNGAPFFVMELLDGVDLEKLVGKVGPLHPDVVVALLAQVAKALDKAHALGIVHRDLKPENIFIHRRQDEPPIVKVLDFGISKFLRPNAGEQSSLGATSAGTLMGTPYYMAPEQARGDVDAIGPATDVWSMGLVALRLLTAEIYWTARTHADLMVDLLAAPMQAPSARWPFLGGKLDSWFARSCHRDPRGRWRTVGEQVKALGDAFEAGDRRNAASMDAIVDLLNGLSSGNHEASPPSAVRQNGPLAGSPSPNQSPNPKTPTVTARVPNLEVAGIPSPIGHTTARGNLARTTNEGGAWNRRRRITVAAVLLAATLIAVAAYGLLMTTSAGPTATPASGVSVDRAGAAPAEAPEPAARVTEAAKPVVAEPEPVPAASADLRAPVRHSGPAARPAPRATPPKPRATSTAPVPTPVPTDDPLRP